MHCVELSKLKDDDRESEECLVKNNAQCSQFNTVTDCVVDEIDHLLVRLPEKMYVGLVLKDENNETSDMVESGISSSVSTINEKLNKKHQKSVVKPLWYDPNSCR